MKSHQSLIFPFQKADGDSILSKTCEVALWSKPTASQNEKLGQSFANRRRGRYSWANVSLSCFCESPLIQLLYCQSLAAGCIFVRRQSKTLGSRGCKWWANKDTPLPRGLARLRRHTDWQMVVGGLLRAHPMPGCLICILTNTHTPMPAYDALWH